MNPDQDSAQKHEPTEKSDGPREAKGSLDARAVLTRVLYETLSGRISDELQWALG